MEHQKASFIDYLYLIVKWRKFIIVNFFIVAIITAIITLVVPKSYTAKTIILPPSDDDQGFGLSQFINELPMGSFGMSGISEESYVVMAILNSRTVMESIINKFDLMKEFDAENMELAVAQLRNYVRIEINEDGTISLFASARTGWLAGEEEEDRARHLATDMANSFITELDKLNIELKTEKAGNKRLYIEKRYHENLADLKKAEEDLKAFQEKYGVIAMPEQTEASIQAAAELTAQMYIKEVEVDVLSKYMSSSHEELVRAKSELASLRLKLKEMKSGFNAEDNVGTSEKSGDLFVPFDDVPELGVQYYRLFREVTLQEKLLEFLLPQYEQAKIQESKDTPTIQVLDKAVPPILRSSPKRGLTVIAMGLASIIVSMLIVFTIEYMHRLRHANADRYEKLEKLSLELKNDYHKVMKKVNRRKYLPEGREDE